MTPQTFDPNPQERVILAAVADGPKSRAQLLGRLREAGFTQITWPTLGRNVDHLLLFNVLRQRREESDLSATGGVLAVTYYRLAPGWTRRRGGQWRRG